MPFPSSTEYHCHYNTLQQRWFLYLNIDGYFNIDAILAVLHLTPLPFYEDLDVFSNFDSYKSCYINYLDDIRILNESDSKRPRE